MVAIGEAEADDPIAWRGACGGEGKRAQGGLIVGQRSTAAQRQHTGTAVIAPADAGLVRKCQNIAGDKSTNDGDCATDNRTTIHIADRSAAIDGDGTAIDGVVKAITTRSNRRGEGKR